MSGWGPITRRRLGQLLAASWPASMHPAHAQLLDQGIGGTGVVGDPKDEPSDQMIGGTGVVGTIRRFGSIYVNGLRIAYPDDLPVMRDDVSIGTKDLRLGHVVRVATMPDRNDLVARSIAIQHEVVGQIEAVADGRITVLGQAVSLEARPDAPHLAVGRVVAVSGLRKIDGTIVASLIEGAEPGVARVAGPLTRSAHGALMMGTLPLTGVDPAFIGRRVFLTGHKVGARLAVTVALAERTTLAQLGPSRFSIEAYVSRAPGGLRLGSGLHLEGGTVAETMEGLAIVTVALDGKQQLVAEKVEAVTPADAAAKPASDDDHKAPNKGDKADKGRKGDAGHDHGQGAGAGGQGAGSPGSSHGGGRH